jgi:hypothetical protein
VSLRDRGISNIELFVDQPLLNQADFMICKKWLRELLFCFDERLRKMPTSLMALCGRRPLIGSNFQASDTVKYLASASNHSLQSQPTTTTKQLMLYYSDCGLLHKLA